MTLNYKLGAKDTPQLKELTVTKRYVFGAKSITLNTELKNEGASPIAFSYRSHNVPSLFGKDGTMAFEGGEKLPRSKDSIFHPVKGYAGTCFGAKTSSGCPGNSAVFYGSGNSLKLTWDMPNFIGVYRWDAPNSPISSFEMATSIISLKAGQNINFTFTIQ